MHDYNNKVMNDYSNQVMHDFETMCDETKPRLFKWYARAILTQMALHSHA